MDIVQQRLTELRADLLEVDKCVLRALLVRQQVVDSIGAVKRTAGVPVADPAVEQEKLVLLHAYAKELGLSEVVVATVMPALFAAARQQQERQRD